MTAKVKKHTSPCWQELQFLTLGVLTLPFPQYCWAVQQVLYLRQESSHRCPESKWIGIQSKISKCSIPTCRINITSIPIDCLFKSTEGKTGLGLLITHREMTTPNAIRVINAGVGSGENKTWSIQIIVLDQCSLSGTWNKTGGLVGIR